MRKTAALFVTVGLIASLAACTPTPSETDEAQECTPVASGPISDALVVTGAFGEEPAVEFESAISVEETQRTVLEEGDGAVAYEGNSATVNFTMYSTETGAQISTTAYDGTDDQTLDLDGTALPGLTKLIQCSTEGSRVAGVVSTVDGFAPEVLEASGFAADSSVFFVVDVISTEEPAAVEPPLESVDGADQELPADFPAVGLEFADSGEPTITVPDTDAPTETQIADIKVGTGAVVEPGDTVVMHYYGVKWSDGEKFDDSWSTGETADFPTDGLITGFSAALEGHTVGSRVVAVIPPADAYGAVGETDHPLAGETLVFVIDILGIG